MNEKTYLNEVDFNKIASIFQKLPTPNGYKWDLTIKVDKNYPQFPVRVYIDLIRIDSTI